MLARHRDGKVLRKLTPEEQTALAGLPVPEQRAKVREMLAARREAQMRRLPPGARDAVSALPPGPERERAFRGALDRVNAFEQAVHGLLTPTERRGLASADPAERPSVFRTEHTGAALA